MSKQDDSLQRSFSLLASQVDANVAPDPCLEKILMKASEKRKPRWNRTTTFVIATVCALLVGGTVVTAGGVDAVLEWFATAKIVNPDGTADYREISEDGMIMLNENQAIKLVPDDIESLRGKEIPIVLGPRVEELLNDSEADAEGAGDL